MGLAVIRSVWLVSANSDVVVGRAWVNGEDGRPKAWFRDVDDADLAAEEQFLAEQLYGGHPSTNNRYPPMPSAAWLPT